MSNQSWWDANQLDTWGLQFHSANHHANREQDPWWITVGDGASIKTSPGRRLYRQPLRTTGQIHHRQPTNKEKDRQSCEVADRAYIPANAVHTDLSPKGPTNTLNMMKAAVSAHLILRICSSSFVWYGMVDTISRRSSRSMGTPCGLMYRVPRMLPHRASWGMSVRVCETKLHHRDSLTVQNVKTQHTSAQSVRTECNDKHTT